MRAARAVIVLGGSGLVGSRLIQLWSDTHELVAPTHAQLDVLDRAMLGNFLSEHPAELVVNAAAWADVDGAEAQRGDESGAAYQLNAAYPGSLAEICAHRNKTLVHISTDYVFDGQNATRPYGEDDPTGPLCWYAQTKWLGEQAVRQANPRACIARIEMPFAATSHRKRDFARTCLARLQSGDGLIGIVDQRITPVFLDDAIEALRRLIEERFIGTVHVAPTSWTTPFEFVRAIARRTGASEDLVKEDSFEHFATQRPARRPQHSWLGVAQAERVIGPGVLRSVGEQLDAWAAQLVAPAV